MKAARVWRAWACEIDVSVRHGGGQLGGGVEIRKWPFAERLKVYKSKRVAEAHRVAAEKVIRVRIVKEIRAVARRASKGGKR